MAGHVYVSYGRQDVAYVRRLVEHLAGEGLTVWADEDVAPQAWWDASMEPPIRAAAVVLVVMTPASQNSDRVRGEITYAHRISRPIIPLLLSGKAFFSQGGLPAIDVVGGEMPDDFLLGHLGKLTETPIVRRSTPGQGRRGAGAPVSGPASTGGGPFGPGGYGAAAGGGYGAAPTSGYAAGPGRGGYGATPGGGYGAAPTSGYAAGPGRGGYGAAPGGGYGAAPTSGYGLGPVGGFGSGGGTGADAQSTGILGGLGGAPGAPGGRLQEPIYYGPVTGAPVSYSPSAAGFGPAYGDAYGDSYGGSASTGVLSPGSYGGAPGPGGHRGNGGRSFGPDAPAWGAFGPDGADDEDGPPIGNHAAPRRWRVPHLAGGGVSLLVVVGLTVLLLQPGSSEGKPTPAGAGAVDILPSRDLTTTSAAAIAPTASAGATTPSASPTKSPTKKPTTPPAAPTTATTTTTTTQPPPPVIPNITDVTLLAPPPTAAGDTQSGTITLSGTYPSALTIMLTSSDETVATVQASAPVASGQMTASFTITLVATGTVTFTATLAGVPPKSATATY